MSAVDINTVQSASTEHKDAQAQAHNNNAVVKIRKSNDRGHADHGWLNSYHTFSFASYYDPEFAQFHSFRVLNEDRVAPSGGFPAHPHSEFEIFSYVIKGALRHKDSMGSNEVIGRGTVQFTSAGTGMRHSEFNASDKDLVHFLQLWVKPSVSGLAPSYQTRYFSDASKQGKLKLIIAPDGQAFRETHTDKKTDEKETEKDTPAIKINADVRVYASILKQGERVSLSVDKGRDAYIHLVQDVTAQDKEANKTAIKVNGTLLKAGDGAFVTHDKPDESSTIVIEGASPDSAAELVLLDIAHTPKRPSGW